MKIFQKIPYLSTNVFHNMLLLHVRRFWDEIESAQYTDAKKTQSQYAEGEL